MSRLGRCVDCIAAGRRNQRSANHPGPRCSSCHRVHECAQGRHHSRCPKGCPEKARR